MKRHADLYGLLIMAFAAVTGFAGVPGHPDRISYPPLQWQVPSGAPFRTELATGLTAYVAEDRTLPLVRIIGYVRHGSLHDPDGRAGLSALMARCMRTAGTRQYPADTLDALLERYAINAGFGMKETQMSFSFSFLSEYTDTAFALIAEMILHPAFEDTKLAQEKKIAADRIAHRFDNPEPVVRAAYDKALFAGTRASRLSTVAGIESVDRAALVKLHAGVMRASNVIVGVAGDFDRADMLRRLTALFPADSSDAPRIPFPEVQPSSPVRLLKVHKPITQTQVRFGLPLFTRPHPDYYPLSALSLILGGGGFTSRLGTRVRSDEGLTYAIYSRLGSNYIFPGTFSVVFQTKAENTARVLALCSEEIEKIRENGVTEDELALAKNVLVDGLPSMFRGPADIVEHYAWSEYYGRKPDHFRVYPEKIRALTAEDLLQAAKKWLDPDSLVYAIVGDTTRMARTGSAGGFSLDSLAPALTIDQDALVDYEQ